MSMCEVDPLPRLDNPKKKKQILLRMSENLYEAVEKAIEMGIADNASEFVRRCVVSQLLDLNLLEVPKKTG